MEDFITNIAKGEGHWVIILILGGFSAFTILEKLFSKRAKERDAADDRLVNILQATVKELENKVSALDKNVKESNEKIATLRGENETLKCALQGKDQESLEFKKRILESAENTKQVLAVIISMADTTNKTYSSIENLYKLIAAGNRTSLPSNQMN